MHLIYTPLYKFFGKDRLDAWVQGYRFKRLDLLGPPAEIFDFPIFVHVPKAAGSSIRSIGARTSPGHKPFMFYERWSRIYRKRLRAFAVVRNPYTRYVSAFEYLKAGGKTAIDRHWSAKNSLESFDLNSFATERLIYHATQSCMHFTPQVNFLRSRTGRIGVEHILYYEELHNAWPGFAKNFGLPEELPSYNRAKGSSTPKLTEGAKVVIKNVYHADFQTLGYNINLD